MTNSTRPTNRLGFTESYRAEHIAVGELVEDLQHLLIAHALNSEADLNGVGQINYGNVANLKHVRKTLESARDFLEVAVSHEGAGC
jgi:hypothetical protein